MEDTMGIPNMAQGIPELRGSGLFERPGRISSLAVSMNWVSFFWVS